MLPLGRLLADLCWPAETLEEAEVPVNFLEVISEKTGVPLDDLRRAQVPPPLLCTTGRTGPSSG